jgi:ABC-type antimicrobial peptide transport system permease subunit
VSLLLAAMGTYGLLSYLVANRTRELAIRAALGATRSKLVALVVLGGVGLIGTGVILGIAGALAMSRLLSSQLVDVGPLDPVALGVAVAVIAVAALLAALVPALRASAANPSLTLRAE